MTTKYFNDAIMGIASIINGMGNDYLRNQISWRFFQPEIEDQINHIDDLINMVHTEHMNENDYRMYATFTYIKQKLEIALKYKRAPRIQADMFCL